ncbi:MAG: hypothetical protein HQK49_03090 [Oligoflexia bacterium]|nr:hypothetical protein [Oligoflexia bacterium]
MINERLLTAQKSKYFKYIFFLFLFVSILLIHWKIISEDPLLGYDDDFVVVPMEKVVGIDDYLLKIKNREIFDIQPIRDLSYYVDFQIKKHLNLSVHHFNNLIIWMLILYMLFTLLTTHVDMSSNSINNTSKLIMYLLVLLYAFHPCFTNALLWVTARKHLLSTIFILLATYFLIVSTINKNEREDGPDNKHLFLIVLFYFLSCFSQPINILWPIWGLVFIFYKHNYTYRLLLHKRWIITFSFLAITLFSCAILNIFYYTKIYIHQTAISKYISTADDQISYKILSFGRYFWQVLVPFWSTPTSYYPGSILNIFGIILTVIVFWGIYKTKNRLLIIWCLFSILPILVVTINLTNIFGSDTYILNTGIGMYIIAGIVMKDYSDLLLIKQIKQINQVKRRCIKYLASLMFIITLLIFIYHSLQVSSSWYSNYTLFERATKIELTPFNLKNHIVNLIKNAEFQKSVILAQRLIEWDPYGNNVDKVYATAIYKCTDLSIQSKIKLLESKLLIIKNSPWLKYYLACIFASQNTFSKAYYIVDSISENDFNYFQVDVSIVLAEYIFFYKMASKENKAKKDFLELKFQLKDKVERIKKMSKTEWNEQKFLDNLKLLGIDENVLSY